MHCNENHNIDEYIELSKRYNDLQQAIKQIMDEADLSDTIVIARCHKMDDNTGKLEIAAMGCTCGIENIIIGIANEARIPLMKLAIDQLKGKLNVK